MVISYGWGVYRLVDNKLQTRSYGRVKGLGGWGGWQVVPRGGVGGGPGGGGEGGGGSFMVTSITHVSEG